MVIVVISILTHQTLVTRVTSVKSANHESVCHSLTPITSKPSWDANTTNLLGRCVIKFFRASERRQDKWGVATVENLGGAHNATMVLCRHYWKAIMPLLLLMLNSNTR